MKTEATKKRVQQNPTNVAAKDNGTLKKNSRIKKEESGKPLYIVGIGASAGGLNAVSELVSQIPAGINAAVLVVLHLAKTGLGDILAIRLQKHTRLPCKIAEDQEIVKPGQIYLAPANAHLLVKENKLILGHGPTENRFRPSIDVLFRSMAVNYGEQAIGIILTGFLSDGASGMLAIKKSGGHCIVQDPNEAEYPDMPLSVLDSLDVDHSVPLKEMGKIILGISKIKRNKSVSPPATVALESKISEQAATGIEVVSQLGEKSVFACPDCGGGLWNVKDGHDGHYRCHIGHSYSQNDLALKQAEAVENTIWVAVRMMEERKLLLRKLATEHNQKGLVRISNNYKEQSDEMGTHIEKLKALLLAIQTQ